MRGLFVVALAAALQTSCAAEEQSPASSQTPLEAAETTDDTADDGTVTSEGVIVGVPVTLTEIKAKRAVRASAAAEASSPERWIEHVISETSDGSTSVVVATAGSEGTPLPPERHERKIAIVETLLGPPVPTQTSFVQEADDEGRLPLCGQVDPAPGAQILLVLRRSSDTLSLVPSGQLAGYLWALQMPNGDYQTSTSQTITSEHLDMLRARR